MITRTLLLLLFAAPLLYAQDRQLTHGPATARRVALVIGNSNYETAPLKNPVNDARDMSTALKNYGFDVIYKENVDQNEMKRAIREFGTQIRNAKVALFYYAGHGVQVNTRNSTRNYLVPVDAKVSAEEEMEYEAVDAGFVLAQMESAQSSVNIVILDACRNNPFARSFRSAANGLAQMDAPSGTLIAYATAPGSIASDNARGRNGLYTQELLKIMATPGLGVEEVFKRVRVSVRSLTRNKQTPWELSSLTDEFTFAERLTAKTGLPPLPNDSPLQKIETETGPGIGTGAGSGGGMGPAQGVTVKEVESSDPEPATETDPNVRIYTLSQVDERPKYLSMPKPGYTEEARKNAITGEVRLSAVLMPTGEVTQIKVVSGLPHGLTEKAIAAARNLKFTPAMKNGKPVAVRVNLQYGFSLY